MANPNQETILLEEAYEEIKKFVLNSKKALELEMWKLKIFLSEVERFCERKLNETSPLAVI